MDIKEVYEAAEREFFGSAACRMSDDPHTTIRQIEDVIFLRDLEREYTCKVYELVTGHYLENADDISIKELWLLLRATPLQRCQAALECIE